MSDIFQEVDEALQEDKAKELWKEWGSTIIISAIVMILTTAAFSGFRAWQGASKEKETTRIIEALESADPITALADISDSSKKGHQSIAVLAAVGEHLKNNKLEDALAVYQKAIADKSMLDDFDDLARVTSVRIQMQIDTEKTKSAEMLETLAPVIKNKKSPWTGHATVEAALIEADYNNAPQKAVELMEDVLSSETTPVDLIERAKAMVHVFKLKAAKQKSENENNSQEG